MLSKEGLKKEFQKEYKKYYEVGVFRDNGFEHKLCPKCGKGFWSAGAEDCGDSCHTPYSFFKKTPGKKTYVEFWKEFAEFWKKRGHEVIPRYPVLSRWRDDLYFTIASIVDFQRLEGGKIVFEYPKNPLMVPQMCLRFPDIANIGVTGRHFSCFMMAGQHAFNPPTEGYWKDECLQYNYEFLTQVLKIPKEKIAYGEDVWNMPDFSAFGPCIEAFSQGSELVNSVFMQYRVDKTRNGFEELPIKVIDVGWGFERLLWFENGTHTAYDACFPREIDFMKKSAGIKVEGDLFNRYAALSAGLNVEEVLNMRQEREKIAKELGTTTAELQKTILPMQAVYAIGDHSRTLLFALADGALPSNTAGGYNLRVLLRRGLSFIADYGFNFGLMDVVKMHADDLKPMFPELSENLDEIEEILAVEKKKFDESRLKAGKIASEIVTGGKLSADKMMTLYESNGITPELLEKAAHDAGKEIEIPTEFYKKLTEKHVMEKKEKEAELQGIDFEKLPATKMDYYLHEDETRLKAKVLAVDASGKIVVLDNTLFYPEGGGQCADHGTINGVQVCEVQKKFGKVLHHLDSDAKKARIAVGKEVEIVVDAQRRKAISRHHSATHLMIASCRKTLGKHVWQTGSKKEENEAHVDITHYQRPSEEEARKIEAQVNDWIMQGIEISSREMDRGEAEKKYGFRLYQGGGAIGKRIRVIDTIGVDVEACGGLHRKNTSEIGFVKITGFEQIQDGVIRVHYKAGPAALAYVQHIEKTVEETAVALGANKASLVASSRKFYEEWKERGKETEKLKEELAKGLADKLVCEAKLGIVEKTIDVDQKTLEKLALEISEKKCTAILSNETGMIVVTCPMDSKHDAIALLKERGMGGGTAKFARGKKK